jgi:hypothetical protein
MSERRFALVDFTYRGKRGRLRVHEAGRTYALPRAVAHAATKRELVARQRPPHWMPPSIFRPPEVLTEAEVIEAEAELKAPGRGRRYRFVPNAHSAQSACDDGAIDTIPIADEVTRRSVPRECLS